MILEKKKKRNELKIQRRLIFFLISFSNRNFKFIDAKKKNEIVHILKL